MSRVYIAKDLKLLDQKEADILDRIFNTDIIQSLTDILYPYKNLEILIENSSLIQEFDEEFTEYELLQLLLDQENVGRERLDLIDKFYDDELFSDDEYIELINAFNFLGKDKSIDKLLEILYNRDIILSKKIEIPSEKIEEIIKKMRIKYPIVEKFPILIANSLLIQELETNYEKDYENEYELLQLLLNQKNVGRERLNLIYRFYNEESLSDDEYIELINTFNFLEEEISIDRLLEILYYRGIILSENIEIPEEEIEEFIKNMRIRYPIVEKFPILIANSLLIQGLEINYKQDYKNEYELLQLLLDQNNVGRERLNLIYRFYNNELLDNDNEYIELINAFNFLGEDKSINKILEILYYRGIISSENIKIPEEKIEEFIKNKRKIYPNKKNAKYRDIPILIEKSPLAEELFEEESEHELLENLLETKNIGKRGLILAKKFYDGIILSDDDYIYLINLFHFLGNDLFIDEILKIFYYKNRLNVLQGKSAFLDRIVENFVEKME